MKLVILFSIIFLFSSLPISISKYYSPKGYKLAVQWPNSYCTTPNYLGVLPPCKTPIPQRFTIHGLWGFYMLPCKVGKLFADSHGDRSYQYGELPKWWPNLKGPDLEFWDYEYDKHARCITGMKPSKYFNLAISVMREVDPVIDLFERRGFTPKSGENYYDPQAFPSAIEKEINVVSEIKCKKNTKGISQLYEVRFCSTSNGVLVNCSYARGNSYTATDCTTQIKFPSDPLPPPQLPTKYTPHDEL